MGFECNLESCFFSIKSCFTSAVNSILVDRGAPHNSPQFCEMARRTQFVHCPLFTLDVGGVFVKLLCPISQLIINKFSFCE